MNSRICILFLLGKQRGWWQSKENFFSSQVSDKEKKKYSPFADFIATAVSIRDGFQNFQDWRFKSNFININRASTFFIGHSAKETRELEIVRNWEFKFWVFNFENFLIHFHVQENEWSLQNVYSSCLLSFFSFPSRCIWVIWLFLSHGEKKHYSYFFFFY